jgi:hypothetical protein
MASNGDTTFSGKINVGLDFADRGQVLYAGGSHYLKMDQATSSDAIRIYGGNEGGLDDTGKRVRIQGNGSAQFFGTVTAGNLRGTRVVQDGSPVIDAKGLINTLSTLRQATMDETQDIRESLRSAIDELVEGFEQQIATMPAGDSE